MMSVCENFAIICLESIKDKNERKTVIDTLENTDHEIIDISLNQVKRFVGNVLSVQNKNGKQYLILSQSAYSVLSSAQLNIISRYCELLPVHINTIQTIGGAGTRSMLAEIFLPPKI